MAKHPKLTSDSELRAQLLNMECGKGAPEGSRSEVRKLGSMFCFCFHL